MLGYKKGVEIEVKSYSHIQGLDGSPIPVNKTSISTPMRITGACLYAHTCICKNADAIVFYLQEYILNRQVWIWKIIENYIFFVLYMLLQPHRD